MKEGKSRSAAWSLRVSRGGTAWLHEEAAKSGWSAAEYSRRMMFSGGWDGVVFDECREIEGKIKTGMPIEAALPYAKSVIERLKQGEIEVREIRALILQSILPALDQAEAKLSAARQVQEAKTRQLLGIDEMVAQLNKAVERGEPS
jgi:hypothetical protein